MDNQQAKEKKPQAKQYLIMSHYASSIYPGLQLINYLQMIIL